MASASLSSFRISHNLHETDGLCLTSSSSFRFTNKSGIKISICRAATSSSSVVFRDLDADDFRHPLDKQNTLLLRTIPGLNDLGKAVLGTVAEQVMVMENIGTSVLVAENQLSSLHKLMVEAAEILNIEAPDLYVRQSPVPNAYTLAVSGRKPFVVVHTSLVELLTRKELQAVLAHELGHLKCDHGIWLTFANILALGAYTIPGFPHIQRAIEDKESKENGEKRRKGRQNMHRDRRPNSVELGGSSYTNSVELGVELGGRLLFLVEQVCRTKKPS